MKKVLLLALLALFLTGDSYSQVKVNFSLTNPRIQTGVFMYDLMATIQAGQTWRPGACNLRIGYSTVPASMLTAIQDNPAVNANTNISSSTVYNAMTTTYNPSLVFISCNILTTASSGFYSFAPGTYRIATLRWTVGGSFTSATMTFRTAASPCLVFDSLVQLAYSTGYTVTNPTVTEVSRLTTEIPKDYALYQNYPNPFNPTTKIKFAIPSNVKREKSNVKLIIYDALGREIETIVNESLKPGMYSVDWNASQYTSGVYFYRLSTENFTDVKRMLLIK